MKKKMWKKWTAFMLALIMMVGSMALPVQEPVQAAAAYMKKMPVKWDLAPQKTITYQSKYKGIGMKNQKAKITNWSITDAEEEGYKKLDFTVKFTRKWNVSPSEVMKINKTGKLGGNIGGLCYVTVLDYQTGKSLDSKNDFDVTTTWGEWKYTGSKYYWGGDSSGDYYIYLTNAKVSATVVYPADYKDLCVGVGGSTSLTDTKANKKYWKKGTALFGKTSYQSKNNKKIAHFMRVK